MDYSVLSQNSQNQPLIHTHSFNFRFLVSPKVPARMKSKKLIENELSSTIQIVTPILQKRSAKKRKRNSRKWEKHTQFCQIPSKSLVMIAVTIWRTWTCQNSIQIKCSDNFSRSHRTGRPAAISELEILSVFISVKRVTKFFLFIFTSPSVFYINFLH